MLTLDLSPKNIERLMANRIVDLDCLKTDPSDFFSRVDGQLFDFVVDGYGNYEAAPIEFQPYRWDETMLGDHDEEFISAFEAEIIHLAPMVFQRKGSVAPLANQNDFCVRYQAEIQEIWNEALELVI